MTPAIVELDRVSIVSLLGVRFWDSLSARVISDGLIVTVFAGTEPRRAVPTYATRTGVFSVRHIPGMRAVERGPGDPDLWTKPPHEAVTLEVTDGQARFVPFRLRTSVPLRGLLSWPDSSRLSPLGSPLDGAPWVPLFSSATRPVPGGVGVIRAQLWDPALRGGHGGPAAWAVLETQLSGRLLARSIADESGRVALLFPYPTPPVESFAASFGSPVSPLSPLSAPAVPRLSDQTWILRIRVMYRPVHPVSRLPDLDDVLDQPEGVLLAEISGSPALEDVQLQFGKETVLRSVDETGQTRPSVLLVRAGSPF